MCTNDENGKRREHDRGHSFSSLFQSPFIKPLESLPIPAIDNQDQDGHKARGDFADECMPKQQRLIEAPNRNQQPTPNEFSFIPLSPSLHKDEDTFLKACQKRCISRRHTIDTTPTTGSHEVLHGLLSSLMVPFRMTDGEEEAADPRRGQRERPPNAVSFDDARDRAGSASRDASGIDPVSDDKRSASATFTNVPSYHQELIEGQDRLERQGIFGSDSHMPVRVMPAAQGATAPSNDDSPSTSRSQFKQSSRRHRHARSQQEARAKTNHPYQFPPNYYGYHQHQPHPYSYDYSSYYQQQQPDQDVPAFHASWPEPYSFHNYSTPSQELHPSYYSSPHHMHPSYRSPMYEDPYHQQSSRHPHSAPPSYHRGYARTTPPLGSQEMEHPQQYKETPSAITEGTTPSRHSPPFEFSPEMSALLGDNSEDDRKPAARQEPSDQAKRPSAQHIPSQETMQHPPDEFEPIPYWHEPTNSSDMFRAMYTGPFAVDPSLVGLPSHYYPTTTPQSDVASMPSQASAPTVGGEGTSWEKRFAELLEFKAKHGHCEVPQNYKDNTSLGIWVNKQRMEQKLRMEGKNSSLNDARLQRLESVGFRWAKRKGQVSWNEKFEELRAYKKKHGNCHVPTKYKENTALGRWVSTQRAEYKRYCEGEKSNMTDEKIRRLEGIGFAWFMAL